MIIKITVVALPAAIGLGYTYFFKQPSDNPVEQASEAVIKEETGVDIDLSPGSEDKK